MGFIFVILHLKLNSIFLLTQIYIILILILLKLFLKIFHILISKIEGNTFYFLDIFDWNFENYREQFRLNVTKVAKFVGQYKHIYIYFNSINSKYEKIISFSCHFCLNTRYVYTFKKISN